MPTIFVLQAIGLYKTLLGLILVEVASCMPFAVLIFRAFVSAIPRELDEAAIIDGAIAADACSSGSSSRCCGRPSSR